MIQARYADLVFKRLYALATKNVSLNTKSTGNIKHRNKFETLLYASKPINEISC